MRPKIIVSGLLSMGAASLLLSSPVLAYQSPAPGGGGGVSGSGGVGATSGTLPNTSADSAGTEANPALIAGAVAGGSLVLLGGLRLAYRRRRD